MDITKHIFSQNFDFDRTAKQLWEYQYTHNPVLRRYCDLLETDRPVFLPIEFFKAFAVQTEEWEAQAVFESSGTTGQTPSKHYVKDLDLYRALSIAGFHYFFSKKQYKILALLPSYLERKNASLVQMVTDWITAFGLPESGFYLHDFQALEQAIAEAENEAVLLIGVAFALLDFAQECAVSLPINSVVIETGGMKGRKEELIRAELHTRLKTALGIPNIVSEYGMTELMSQAYALENGRFAAPPWMRIVITDVHLPNKVLPANTVGRINVIDLGNVHSCAFIATDDAGKCNEDGTFEVLGRIENAELRGCSLMYV